MINPHCLHYGDIIEISICIDSNSYYKKYTSSQYKVIGNDIEGGTLSVASTNSPDFFGYKYTDIQVTKLIAFSMDNVFQIIEYELSLNEPMSEYGVRRN